MDVANDHVVVASKSGDSASALEGGVEFAVDVEVLDKCIVREHAEETEEVAVRRSVEVLDGVSLAVEVSLIGNAGACPVADS